MADLKISALPASTTPLAGTEVLPIVQSSTTRQVSVANLTAGRTQTSNGIVQGTAATGYNFTANTPAAGMTSQLLNWYEEGTWTPVFNNFTFGGTQTVLAKYTRTGRVVYIEFIFSDSVSISGTVVTSYITGLPFPLAGLSATTTTVNEGTVASLGVGLIYVANSRIYLPTFTAAAGQVIVTNAFYFI